VQRGIEWAGWLVSRRAAVDRALALRALDRGEAPPAAGSPESEALRRFRSWAAAALRRGTGDAAPALDGVHADPARALRALEDWCAAAIDVAGPNGAELRGLLAPLTARFEAALTGARVARHVARAGEAAGVARAPRPARRAVVGAIDRIADAFLAVDLADGLVVDANPAAAALLRTPRDALLGAAAERFVHADARAVWGDELAELVESDEPRRFRAVWIDALARPVAIEAHATRHQPNRDRLLALVLARVL
jgi:PAS domain-containing protein